MVKTEFEVLKIWDIFENVENIPYFQNLEFSFNHAYRANSVTVIGYIYQLFVMPFITLKKIFIGLGQHLVCKISKIA